MERAEVYALATEVAAQLGAGWAVDPEWDANGRMIVHSDGRKLHFYSPSYPHSMRGKVTVNGSYPYRPGQYIEPGNHIEINVSASRGAAVIAKEINRRLLPDYTERYAKVIASNDTHSQSVAAVRKVEALLCGALGKSAPDYSQMSEWRRRDVEREARTSVSLYGLIQGYGSVELYAYGPDDVRAKVELSSIPAGTALAIIELLRERGELGKD